MHRWQDGEAATNRAAGAFDVYSLCCAKARQDMAGWIGHKIQLVINVICLFFIYTILSEVVVDPVYPATFIGYQKVRPQGP